MKRKGLLLFTLLILLFVTGCWNRRELNDLAIVMGTGIDKVDGQYLISTQIVNPGQVTARDGGRTDQAAVTTYSLKASTIFEGIRKLTTMTPRRLYFSHIQVLVLSEKVAREGVKEVLDMFFRDHEIRPDFYVILAKDATAIQILSMFEPLEKIPSSKLYKSLETGEKIWGPIVTIQLDEFITALLKDGLEPVLAGVIIKGDKQLGSSDANLKKVHPPAFLKYEEIGVFKEDKLLGWLNERESIGYSYITNKLDSTAEEIPCNSKEKLVIEIIRSKSSIKGRFENGKPQVEVSISAEGNVGDGACSILLSNPKSIYKLEREVEQKISDKIQESVRKVQKKFKSDVFGFGEAIYRDNPKEWEKVKEDWDLTFPDLKVKTKLDVKLRRTGKVGNSFIPFMDKK